MPTFVVELDERIDQMTLRIKKIWKSEDWAKLPADMRRHYPGRLFMVPAKDELDAYVITQKKIEEHNRW